MHRASGERASVIGNFMLMSSGTDSLSSTASIHLFEVPGTKNSASSMGYREALPGFNIPMMPGLSSINSGTNHNTSSSASYPSPTLPSSTYATKSMAGQRCPARVEDALSAASNNFEFVDVR